MVFTASGELFRVAYAGAKVISFLTRRNDTCHDEYGKSVKLSGLMGRSRLSFFLRKPITILVSHHLIQDSFLLCTIKATDQIIIIMMTQN